MEVQKVLFKEEQFRQNYKGDYEGNLLEQYKLYLDMADKISSRRDNANNLFLTFQTLIVGGIGYSLKEFRGIFIIQLFLAGFGIIIGYYWFSLIRSYRQLNTGKFAIIHLIEEQLPASGYKAEWEVLGKGEDKNKYTPVSHLEEKIPCFFIFGYIVCVVYILFPYIRLAVRFL